ncbi:MAG: peptide deformylase [Desulfovibrionaceae bacterium]|nr:peptide deformylase [Desulfovibrionaceae bacterium]
MILPVLQYPDERLRRKSQPVDEITDEIRELASNMLETMYDEEGIGLAAPQVGHFIRMIVIDISPCYETEEGNVEDNGEPPMPMVLINPELSFSGATVKSEEGCLSVPNSYRATVPRREKVSLKALSLDGDPIELEADGMLAICLQHECDHLDGKLFIDYISRLKLNLYKASLRKLVKA